MSRTPGDPLDRPVLRAAWWAAFVFLFAFCFVGVFADFALYQEHRLTEREAYAALFKFLVGIPSLPVAVDPAS